MNASVVNAANGSVAVNPQRLLWAGWVAILAGGMGFGIRGGIFNAWGAEFGFTAAQLGAISGAGFSGFCFGIVLGGLICDRIGYGKLVIGAFALHLLSAIVTVSAGGTGAYASLYWGMFIFSYANGTLEAVANPLVATLFRHDRTHYLNLLHASWPAGLILGGLVGWGLGDLLHLSWRIQLVSYLLPTAIYGVMFFGQAMPQSQASQQRLSLSDMFKDVGILGSLIVCFLLALFAQDALGLPAVWAYGIGAVLLLGTGVLTRFSLGSFLLFVLFLTLGLVGAVELGTDGWIQNITGNLLTPGQGKLLFVLTSATMFGLRLCAGSVERRMGNSPPNMLFICALLACAGLTLTSGIITFAGATCALVLYAAGKSFFWATLLAIASDRFPRTGAIAISLMGGIGMMSAGLLGTPGLGYAKDRFAAEALRDQAPAVYEQYKSATPSQFLYFREVHGLDGKKLGEIQAQAASGVPLSPEARAVHNAGVSGDRSTLKVDAAIPATLAAIFLGLAIYFRSIGGYRRL